ncbi:uncharacterized protein An11g01800 [Aspergillus niger]|uniref:Contig An11c0050, genomic contig n=2 Tax=Aspergillus niger TaxID=5061 RepID=A2QVL0_ASPNC|nr:uncharacterized protein An11g01800 [Aspergillus niger]CAK45914.1 unnamed protein product [Aspergillus niger]
MSLERSGKESMRRQVNIDKTGGRRIAKFQDSDRSKVGGEREEAVKFFWASEGSSKAKGTARGWKSRCQCGSVAGQTPGTMNKLLVVGEDTTTYLRPWIASGGACDCNDRH